MTSITEIMQLCRLCLVKEQVNIPIFEEQGDLQQIIEKISACLPVKVSKEDKLPKKICDGCSYKLELLYQFRNTTVTAEKQLLSWINQLGGNKVENEVKSQPATQHIVKEEVEIVDTADHPDTEYLLGQQITFEGGDTPFLESQDDNGAGDDEITNSSDDEPLAKRRKRLLEDQGQISAGESKEGVVQHMAVTKTEDASDSEGEENVDDPEPNFVSVGTDDIQQPGPSGVGKAATTDIPLAPEENVFEFIDIKEPRVIEQLSNYDREGTSSGILTDEIHVICNDIDFDTDQDDVIFVPVPEEVQGITEYTLESVNRTMSITSRIACKVCKKRVKPNATTYVDGTIICNKCAISSRTCKYCDKKLPTPIMLNAHLEEKHHCKCCNKYYNQPLKHRNLMSKIRCTYCTLLFSKQELQQHMEETHACAYCRKYYSKTVFHKSDTVKCILCDIKICKKAEIRKHYLIEHDRQWCARCNSTFASKEELFTHIKSHVEKTVL